METQTLLLLSILGCVAAWSPRPFNQHLLHERHVGHEVDRQRRESDCAEKPADLVFVLDGSSSIWGPDFTTQLDFVSDVVESFHVGPDHMHFGAVTFADRVEVKLGLTESDNKETIQNIIKDIAQPRGATNTDMAIKKMRLQLFNPGFARAGIPHIGVVITDGQSAYPNRTAREAQFARNEGITMFAIGIGREDKLQEDGIIQELHAIASSPEYVFTADTYDMLDLLKQQLADKACEATTMAPTTPPPQNIIGCDGSSPTDVIFALPDEAGVADTDLALEFINSMVDDFNIGSTTMQVGLTPRLCADLEGIRLEQHDQQQSLQQAIGERGLGATQLSLQFEYLLDYGFSGKGGSRRGVDKVAILLVDNRVDDPDTALTLAAELAAGGVTVVMVGIGGRPNQQLLSQMATSADGAYHVNSYAGLLDIKQKIHNELCSRPIPPPQMVDGCDGRDPMDVLVATPDEANVQQTDAALAFIQKVVSSFWLNEAGVQVGLTPRLCGDLEGIGLGIHDDSSALQRSLGERGLSSTLLSLQLEYALHQGLTQEDGARQGAHSYLLLMVDNALADQQLAFSLAQTLKDLGVTIMVVGVGPYAMELDLMQVATSIDHVFMVDDYNSLDGVVEQVKRAFCPGTLQ